MPLLRQLMVARRCYAYAMLFATITFAAVIAMPRYMLPLLIQH